MVIDQYHHPQTLSLRQGLLDVHGIGYANLWPPIVTKARTVAVHTPIYSYYLRYEGL